MNMDPTASTEASFSIDSIKELMDGFDPAALLPQLESVFDTIVTICKVSVLIAPVLLLVLGLVYLFLTPKEANHYIGYRTWYGMGSVQAWRFTQRLAGTVFAGLGLVLGIVMLLLSAGFGGMDQMALVWRTVKCLAWEAGLSLAGVLGINITAMTMFDGKGEYRKKRKK